MDMSRVSQLLSEPGRVAILSTADPQGKPNSAIFGSVQVKESQITIGMSDNVTLENLRANPSATLMIVLPGENILNYRGIRLQLTCQGVEDSGPLLAEIRMAVQEQAGKSAARMILHAVQFAVVGCRELIEFSPHYRQG